MNARQRSVDAATRFERAVVFLRHEAKDATPLGRAVLGHDAYALLWRVLFNADDLVDVLNDDADLDDLERYARQVASALRRRRLAGLLEQTDGRTVEETASFQAKARELRDA